MLQLDYLSIIDTATILSIITVSSLHHIMCNFSTESHDDGHTKKILSKL